MMKRICDSWSITKQSYVINQCLTNKQANENTKQTGIITNKCQTLTKN